MPAKPIIIIYAPERTVKPEQHEHIRSAGIFWTQNEYHVIVVPTKEKEFLFEALYDKDFDEIKYVELQEKIAAQFK